ncbi:MarR family transcriptional regulator [Shewanella avicenniae]|uniref:MarR family transcriptional regulator n=1 Tax=Shewanella avicenniae TaxID=2814294 RepID=A0ABX7QU83_9GAMM|nr:MarR family transcriptional regulator [Shewanella avicenniae]QSX34206.1 MarR family transcriptional regulator [Shewanella avicenniae]
MSVSQLLFSVLDAYKTALLSAFSKQLPELSLLHFRVLRQVGRGAEAETGVTPLQIAQGLQRDKAQVTRLLAELTDKAWLVKVPHPQDKRSVLLQLTPQGQVLLDQALLLEQQVSAAMTQGVSAAQQQALSEGLIKLQQNLSAI